MSAAIVVAALYVTYRLVDPLPPRHFVIAAGAAGSGYDNFARQYARILARQGVELEIRNSVGAVKISLCCVIRLRVQAAVATFGVTQPADADIFDSLGGIFECGEFIFYRNVELLRFPRSSVATPFDRHAGNRATIAYAGSSKNH